MEYLWQIMLLLGNNYGFGPKAVYVLLCVDVLLKKTNHTPATKCILEKASVRGTDKEKDPWEIQIVMKKTTSAKMPHSENGR